MWFDRSTRLAAQEGYQLHWMPWMGWVVWPQWLLPRGRPKGGLQERATGVSACPNNNSSRCRPEGEVERSRWLRVCKVEWITLITVAETANRSLGASHLQCIPVLLPLIRPDVAACIPR